jgi:uncharacterized damage-inducible protein DinB
VPPCGNEERRIEVKDGRGRRYDFAPLEGFAHEGVAFAAAALEELGERYLDLVVDLPEEALQRVPEHGGNSMAMLGIHMIWAEASWAARIAGRAMPAEVEARVRLGRQGEDGEIPYSRESAASLRQALALSRAGHVYPVLRGIGDWAARLPDGAMTARGVLMHVAWHWSNHTGQVGLLRRFTGERYRWRFG